MIVEKIVRNVHHNKKVKEVVISNHGQEYTITSCFEGIKIIKNDARNKMMILPDAKDSIIIS